jgi:hypothetical protein
MLPHSFEEDEARFFIAWKRGVHAVREEYYGPKTIATAQCKQDLAPDLYAFEQEFCVLSTYEKRFVGAFLSFYDKDFAVKIMKKAKINPAVSYLVAEIQSVYWKEIICDLIRHYRGWVK